MNSSQHTLVRADIPWRVHPQADLRWRQWPDEQAVLYHPRSGETHLLNPISAAMLQTLQDQPLSLEQLIPLVLKRFDLPAAGDHVAQLQHCLAQFIELGLIEPGHADS